MNDGAKAELVAAQYLRHQGLKIVTQNYRCRFGEIDLILQDGEILVFAEVRLRNSKNFGGAAASIDARKQGKLIITAQHYLSKLSYLPQCRFDAVLMKSSPLQANSSKVYSEPDFPVADIEWIKNAFGA